MIADINESGRISVKSETDQESEMLKSWLQENAFKFDMKPRMIEQECAVCGNKFNGTALIEVCPKCYV